MSVTATTIVNQALQLLGDDTPPVTGVYPTFDSSVAGVAAANLYGPCVNTVARQFGWDFERNVAALSASGNQPPVGWNYEYLYPTNGIEVWQLMPPVINDTNDPLPQNWSVGNVMVSSVPTKVIWSNLTGAVAVFANQPGPNVWDPLFREAVVRLLASEMAVAVAGKPDTGRDLLESSSGFGQAGMGRPD
jgi:hypothetical protein